MKFLLEFVTCCTSCRSASETSSSLRPGEDTRSLFPTVPPSTPPENRHYLITKRWRMAATKPGSASDWRPSLNAISEDNVAVVERNNRTTPAAKSERIMKRKVSPSTRSHHRNRRSNDYPRDPIPAMMPAFSPTPFLL